MVFHHVLCLERSERNGYKNGQRTHIRYIRYNFLDTPQQFVEKKELHQQ